MARYFNIFQSVPFIRITLWFAAGILCKDIFDFPDKIWWMVFFLLLPAIVFLSQKSNYRSVGASNYLITLSLFLVGCWHANQNDCLLPAFSPGKECYSGVVLEKLSEKPKSFQTILEIRDIKENTYGKVIAYFRKEEGIEHLIPGCQIVFSARLNLIKNQGNPFETDYQAFMQRQGIGYSVYLTSDDYTVLTKRSSNLFIRAENCRDKLLSILRQHNISGEEYTVVAALTLGYRKELDAETRDYFASSGAMHVLAVSGLHVGIIYLLFAFLLSPLKRKRYGALPYTVLVASLIWFYALLAGLSPSVQRAAVMFTFVLIGQNMKRPVNIFNSLAASAFLLMLFNPQVILEVGFQLSYLAVAGIVLFQPVFYHMINVPNRWLDKLWSLLTVSIAAQLATFPLGLFYFSQFPNYFWLSNFIVIPAATLILGATFLLFLLSPVPVLSDWIGIIIRESTRLMLVSLKGIDSLPLAVTGNISISPLQAVLLMLIIAFGYWFIQSKSIRELRLLLLLTGAFFLSSFSQNYRLLNQKKMIVYNFEYPVIQFINGRNNYILTDPAKISEEQLSRLIKNVGTHLKLNSPQYIPLGEDIKFADKNLIIRSQVVWFSGETIQFAGDRQAAFPCDYRIVFNNFSKINALENFGKIIFIARKPYSGHNSAINIFQTWRDGAFIADFTEN
ncbi:MAG: ComEC/Rec2 family competence protein [Prolixibacteraceae bacterium]|nr:ComEC/Rec2 family competence protein [Prolixibacteraceae bacterium]